MREVDGLWEELVERGYGERLCTDEPLSAYTSLRIGGPADLLIVARELAELGELVRMAQARGVPSLVIGGGTNILVADAGVRGLVIVNACRGHSIDGQGLLTAQSGALLSKLSRWTVSQGWKGLEWAAGIPGTVGGAVVGNAGAYGGCMAANLRWVALLQPDGSAERVGVDALGYGYRTSVLRGEPQRDRTPVVVLEAALQLTQASVEELTRVVEKITVDRKMRTPEGQSVGSTFRRTPQYPAGFLIEQAGLKGRRIGGAVVSEKHANYLMNAGGATADEMRALVELVQKEVWDEFAQALEPEIEFVGEWA